MTKQDDGLFLLEVLIDKITFVKTPCMNDNNFRTCVNVQCLSVEPLEICDDDPSVTSSKSPGAFVKNFNAGKSCLFSLKEGEITKAMSSFPVKVNVYKSLPCSCLPSTVVMGEATIDMTKEFVEARKRFLADPNVVTYQALKDSFHLMGPDGTESGEIVMFIRISCFGKLIITQFQGNCGPPQLGSGGTVGAIERTCNPPRSYQSSMDPCVCGAAHASSSAPRSPGPPCASCGASTKQTGGPCPVARDPYNSMPCEEPEDECYCSGPKPKRKQAMACRNTDQYCLHLPKARSKQYEEMNLNLTGNELKIKIPANCSVIKRISQTHLALQAPFTKGKDPGLCAAPCAKNQVTMMLPSEDICCDGARLTDTRFACTTEGCTQAGKHQALARGDARGLPPNNDVYILKVAKTAYEGEKKLKLEVEVAAPKGADKKLPVAKENRRLQADNCECCVRCSGRRCRKKR